MCTLFLKTSLKKDLSRHFIVTFTVGYLSKPPLAAGQSFCFDSWSKGGKKLLAVFTVSLCQDKPSNYCFWCANTTVSHWKRIFGIKRLYSIKLWGHSSFRATKPSVWTKQFDLKPRWWDYFWRLLSWVQQEQQMQDCKFHHQASSKAPLTPESFSLLSFMSTMRFVGRVQIFSRFKDLLPILRYAGMYLW